MDARLIMEFGAGWRHILDNAARRAAAAELLALQNVAAVELLPRLTVTFASAQGRAWRATQLEGHIWELDRLMRAGKRDGVQQWGWRRAGTTGDVVAKIKAVGGLT